MTELSCLVLGVYAPPGLTIPPIPPGPQQPPDQPPAPEHPLPEPEPPMAPEPGRHEPEPPSRPEPDLPNIDEMPNS